MVDIREGTIVRYDDDTETPWLVVHIDDNDGSLIKPATSRKVWIRKMTKVGRDIQNVPAWDTQDIVTTINRLWVA